MQLTSRGSLLGHKGRCFDVRLSETGQFAVSASEDGTARVWNMASKKTIGTLNSGGDAEVLRVALLGSQRATTVVTCTADGVARIWTRPQPNQAYGITGRFDHSGGKIYLWDLEQETRQHWAFDREGTCHFGGQRNPDDEVVVFDAKPAPNQSDIIAIALSDGTLRTLDLREDAARIIGQASDVHLTSITWRDPTTVITCSGTGEVASWDIRTSARLSTIQAHDRAVFGAALLDSTLLTYSSDSLLKLWDINPADGTTHHTCTQVLDNFPVYSCAVDLQRQLLVCGGGSSEQAICGTPVHIFKYGAHDHEG